jgi:RHS repeat-associated protein
LDEAELIHMNGRVYDYNVGRFLSVDPYIIDQGNSQAINPYTYVINNPMGYTDPTGYSRESREAWFSYGRGTREDKSYRRAPRERKSNQAESNGANSQQEPSPKPSSPSFQSPKVEDTSKTKIDDATNTDKSTSGNGENPQQKTTDDGFRKNSNLDVNVKDGVISIKGTVYSKLDIDAETFNAYLTKEFSGDFDIDGTKYTFDIDLEHVMWDEQGDIKLTAIRGLPPKDGSLFYRSNAQHGGREINLSMYERNVQKTAAHEFMHILGFGDTYRDTAKGSESFRGHENDIMGSSSGNIQNYHVRTMLRNYKD